MNSSIRTVSIDWTA